MRNCISVLILPLLVVTAAMSLGCEAPNDLDLEYGEGEALAGSADKADQARACGDPRFEIGEADLAVPATMMLDHFGLNAEIQRRQVLIANAEGEGVRGRIGRALSDGGLRLRKRRGELLLPVGDVITSMGGDFLFDPELGFANGRLGRHAWTYDLEAESVARDLGDPEWVMAVNRPAEGEPTFTFTDPVQGYGFSGLLPEDFDGDLQEDEVPGLMEFAEDFYEFEPLPADALLVDDQAHLALLPPVFFAPDGAVEAAGAQKKFSAELDGEVTVYVKTKDYIIIVVLKGKGTYSSGVIYRDVLKKLRGKKVETGHDIEGEIEILVKVYCGNIKKETKNVDGKEVTTTDADTIVEVHVKVKGARSVREEVVGALDGLGIGE